MQRNQFMNKTTSSNIFKNKKIIYALSQKKSGHLKFALAYKIILYHE